MLDTIHVGATEYKIIQRDAKWRVYSECDGQVRFDDLEIDIVMDRPASELANTIIHELMHVAYREWHIKPGCGEERTVTALGFAMTAIYAQNPELLSWLEDILHG